MTESQKQLSRDIINKAVSFGASLAGIANIEDLKQSPSHTISEKLEDFTGVGTKQVAGRKNGEVVWPEDAESAVVIAIHHPEKAPEMDWWLKGLRGGDHWQCHVDRCYQQIIRLA